MGSTTGNAGASSSLEMREALLLLRHAQNPRHLHRGQNHWPGMSDGVANLQHGATQAFFHEVTLIGGLLAARVLGFRRSLYWGASS